MVFLHWNVSNYKITKLQFYVELATRFVRYRATFSNIGNHNYEF